MSIDGRKLTTILGAVFAAVDAIALAIGIALFVGTSQKHAVGETVQAQIDRIDVYATSEGAGSNRSTSTNHDVYVSYEYDGGSYANVFLGFYEGSMYEGGAAGASSRPRPGNVAVPGSAAMTLPGFLGRVASSW